MKIILASLLVAGSLSNCAAFLVERAGVRKNLVAPLQASRAASKKESRTKWLESRGISDVVDTVGSTGAAGLMKNDQGLEYVKLVHPETGASSEVYLFGGVVTSYQDADGTEFIAVRPDAKMDGSKPISGGLSHCWPQVSVAFHALLLMDFLVPHCFVTLSLAVWSG